MKKRFLIISILIIAIIFAFFTITKVPKYIPAFSNVNDDSTKMEAIMLGESNMLDKGNTNACGYIIITENEELIIVDGGREVDKDIVLNYINKIGRGTVNYWFLTHPHGDHCRCSSRIIRQREHYSTKFMLFI